MSLGVLLMSFIVGGVVTALVVGLESSGQRVWSGLAMLAPVLTIVSYFFIGSTKDAIAVSQHSKFVLFGTLASWIPYIAVIAYTAPRLGTVRAILLGLFVFLVLAMAYIWVVQRYRLFQ